jgi:16S rRNA (uracil1498-N3)-methyltransferase
LNLFYHPDLTPQFQLAAEEARHAIKALRHQAGDVIRLTDGKGNFAQARITQIKKEECSCELIDKEPGQQKNFSIHLAIAATKNSDRTEWMLEKCVEIGVDQVSIMVCKHSERRKSNFDRLQKVAISALKQSQQCWLPQLKTDLPFPEIARTTAGERFIAFVDATNPAHLAKVATAKKSYLILVGPEGDFSEDELSLALTHGFRKVSLGPNRLRTETAGIAACHILNLINS